MDADRGDACVWEGYDGKFVVTLVPVSRLWSATVCVSFVGWYCRGWLFVVFSTSVTEDMFWKEDMALWGFQREVLCSASGCEEKDVDSGA